MDKKNQIMLAIVGFNLFLIVTVAIMWAMFPDSLFLQYGAGVAAGLVGGAIGWFLGPLVG